MGALAVDQARVNTPLLVVVGAEDRLTPTQVVSKVAQKYGADFRSYAKHGHLLNVEDGWELPAFDVVRWLSQRLPPIKRFEV